MSNQEFVPKELPHFPAIAPPRPVSVELLITDSPVREYDNRKVSDRTRIDFVTNNKWYSFKLLGENPEHQFFGRMRHIGWLVELELQIVLHGQIRNVVLKRDRADMKVKRIWISRGYIHGDMGGTCFPVATQQLEAFESEVWFATLEPGSEYRKIMGESRRVYKHGDNPLGRAKIALHDDHTFMHEWATHPDGVGRDFRTTWFRGDELIGETIESVFGMKEAVAAGCFAMALGSYCDRDSI